MNHINKISNNSVLKHRKEKEKEINISMFLIERFNIEDSQ